MTYFNDLSDVCGVSFCSQVFINHYKTNCLKLAIAGHLRVTENYARERLGRSCVELQHGTVFGDYY